MTTSRTLEELKLLKSKLVKLAAKEDVETTTEEFVDILSVLEKSNIAADMIQPSKSGLSLGPTVRNFLNKLKEGTAAHDKGRQLLKVWKDIVTRNNIAAAGSKGENRKALSTIEPATFVVNKSVSLAPSIESNHLLAAQPPAQQVSSGKNSINARKAARIVLQTACKDIANAADVERVVNAVEAALDANFSDKEYSSKYRSLAANLKKNKTLFPNVLSGAISVQRLIHMTPAEMASDEIKESREKIIQEQSSARSMHWAEEHKEKIHELLGMDPNNTWEYDDEEKGLSEPDIETGDA